MNFNSNCLCAAGIVHVQRSDCPEVVGKMAWAAQSEAAVRYNHPWHDEGCVSESMYRARYSGYRLQVLDGTRYRNRTYVPAALAKNRMLYLIE